MSMDISISRDVRSDEEAKKCFIYGKKNEKIVFDNLPFKGYWVNGREEFDRIEGYKPDCFLYSSEYGWRPVEIKYTWFELRAYVELKDNQCRDLADLGGFYLQATPTKYCILEARKILDHGVWVKEGYCHKAVFRFDNPKWVRWGKKIQFIEKEMSTITP